MQSTFGIVTKFTYTEYTLKGLWGAAMATKF